jgi:hypothetical protein
MKKHSSRRAGNKITKLDRETLGRLSGGDPDTVPLPSPLISWDPACNPYTVPPHRF